MTNDEPQPPIVPEDLWSGEFGDAYVERNARLDERRTAFWSELVTGSDIASVLEVGCGQGGNLRPLGLLLEPRAVWGIDVNERALAKARSNAPETNVVYGSARALPFRDRAFDLVFTMGVLIHQPDDALAAVMDEMVRCSDRFVLAGEYHAAATTEVPYHGVRGALFKRDYGRLFRERHPSLELRREGFLDVEEGFDRVTYQLFERP
jgi:pseudaminic acid biosynthesis-associated methylase